MSRFRGIYIASFALGVLTPIAAVLFLISQVPDTQEVIDNTPAQTIVVPAADVDIFNVEYDMYGRYTLGEDIIGCQVVNNQHNSHNCVVYLVEDGLEITERAELMPSNRILSFKLNSTYWQETGEYPMTLVYEIETENGNTTIECPYTLQVNKER